MLETMLCIVTATIHKWFSLYGILICSPYQQWQQSQQEHHRRWDPLWAFWPSPLLSLSPFPTHYHHHQFLSSQKNKYVLNCEKNRLMGILKQGFLKQMFHKLTQLSIWIPFCLWTLSRKLLYLFFYSSLDYCEQPKYLIAFTLMGQFISKKKNKHFPKVCFFFFWPNLPLLQ